MEHEETAIEKEVENQIGPLIPMEEVSDPLFGEREETIRRKKQKFEKYANEDFKSLETFAQKKGWEVDHMLSLAIPYTKKYGAISQMNVRGPRREQIFISFIQSESWRVEAMIDNKIDAKTGTNMSDEYFKTREEAIAQVKKYITEKEKKTENITQEEI